MPNPYVWMERDEGEERSEGTEMYYIFVYSGHLPFLSSIHLPPFQEYLKHTTGFIGKKKKKNLD
jgi:hypothetical protein